MSSTSFCEPGTGTFADEREFLRTQNLKVDRSLSGNDGPALPGRYSTRQRHPDPDLDIFFVVKNLRNLWPDIDELTTADIQRQSRRFRGGINNWVVQSYLQLREPLAQAGIRARITDWFVCNAICIAHRDHLNCFLDFCERAYIVAIRADRPPVRIGNRQIVQNALTGRHASERYVPLWPQPGLIARDPRRGDRIEHIAYFGRDASMTQGLRDPRFLDSLMRIGIRFSVRTREWHDYSDVDLILAHRIASPTLLREKPPSKLTNAWLAGVPALLSDEPAYAALRRSGLDYLAIDTPQSLLRGIERLRSEPSTYRAMIENGHERAREYCADAVRERWLEFILADVVPDFLSSRSALPPLLRLPPFLARLVRQKIAAKAFRRRMVAELRSLHDADPSRDSPEPGYHEIDSPRPVPYHHIAA